MISINSQKGNLLYRRMDQLFVDMPPELTELIDTLVTDIARIGQENGMFGSQQQISAITQPEIERLIEETRLRNSTFKSLYKQLDDYADGVSQRADATDSEVAKKLSIERFEQIFAEYKQLRDQNDERINKKIEKSDKKRVNLGNKLREQIAILQRQSPVDRDARKQSVLAVKRQLDKLNIDSNQETQDRLESIQTERRERRQAVSRLEQIIQRVGDKTRAEFASEREQRRADLASEREQTIADLASEREQT